MTNKQKFVENKKAYELYVKTPLLKSLIKVIIPGLLISLMMSIYMFVDQVLIACLVPHDGVHTFENLFGHTEYEISEALKHLNQDFTSFHGVIFNSGDVIKSAITISSPILVVLTSLPFFIATGSSVIFTQAIGKNNAKKAYEIWKISFWMAFLIGALITLILTTSARELLSLFSGKQVQLPLEAASKPYYELLNNYYAKVHFLQIQFSYDFVIVLASSAILPCLMLYFSSVIRAEGRLIYPTVVSIVCNLINILLDFLLINYAKTGVQSGGFATFSGWILNFLLLFFYICYLNFRKKFTWLKIKKLSLFKNDVDWNIRLASPIILLGFSGFLVDFTYSIAMMFYLPVLSSTAMAIGVPGGGEYYMTISGAVIPILNLFFSTIWGIVDGGRPIDSYNYSIGNFERIKKTYFYIIIIAFIYSLLCLAFIALVGKPFLHLFQIQDFMMADAYKYLTIEMVMVLIFSFQVSAILMLQGTNQILFANIASIFQDVIVYYPTLFVVKSISIATDNIWILIANYVINALIASIFITSFSIWFINKRLGKLKIKITLNKKKKNLYVPCSLINMSLAERAVEII